MERRQEIVFTVGFPGPVALIYILQQLEENQDELGITAIGVTMASLEHVLLKYASCLEIW